MTEINQCIHRLRDLLSKETYKKYLVVFSIFLVFSILCETIVFNFKFWTSVADKELIVDNNQLKLTSGIKRNTDGSLKFEAADAVIEIENINKEIKYLYINLGTNENEVTELTLSAKDAANNNYFSVPKRKIASGVESSKYIRTHFSGEVKSLKLGLKGAKDRELPNDILKINVKVPLMFSWFRLVLLFGILSLIYLFRPKSFVHRYKTNLKSKKQLLIVILILVAQALVFWNSINLNQTSVGWHKTIAHHQQYYRLVDSIKKGQLFISDEVDPKLKELENPYDTGERAQKRIPIKWDTAYYNGKYYVYFGIVPALTLYLPYNLITGGNLPNYIAIYIIGILYMVGIFVLLWQIIKKWYKSTVPLSIYLLLCVGSIFCGLAYVTQKPDFYSVPSLMAVVLAIFGLALWLSAEKKKDDGISKLSTWRIALGAMLIALIAGCRPQLLIVIVFGIFLFWNAVFKDRTLFSKSGLKQTVGLVIPFVIVATFIMWYNYARFGSVFDFGANYNMTTNDMTHRGFVFGRIGLGVFSMLLKPLSLNAVFPFIHDMGVDTVYQGLTLTERAIGGVLWLYPITLIGVFGSFKPNIYKDKIQYRFVYGSVIMAVILAILATQVAGILIRYFIDFVWLMIIASAVTVFACCERKDIKQNNLLKIVLVMTGLTMVLSVLQVFAMSENSLMAANPAFYHWFEHLIAFWM